MFDRIRTMFQRRAELRQIEALSDRDLQDLGMSRSQLRDFLHMPADTVQRVTAMGAIFGRTSDDLRRDHAEWNDMLSNCGYCAERDSCSRLLELGDLAHPDQATFCDNREILAGQPGPAH